MRRRELVLGGAGIGVAAFAEKPAHGAAAGEGGVSTALYQATAIVTGTDMRERPIGFRRCLVEVLGKLTGRPSIGEDPRVSDLVARADEFVASFDYVDPRAGLLHHDDQGTYDRSYELTVRFDPAKVNAAVTGLGFSLWAGVRPALAPVVLVRDREPVPFFLAQGEARAREMRATLVRVASEKGVGVRFPSEGDLAAMGVGPIGFPEPLTEAGPGLARVTGTLSWNVHAMGWVGSWRMAAGGAVHGWGISGVGFDVALENLARGAVMLMAGTGVP